MVPYTLALPPSTALVCRGLWGLELPGFLKEGRANPEDGELAVLRRIDRHQGLDGSFPTNACFVIEVAIHLASRRIAAPLSDVNEEKMKTKLGSK